MPEWTGAGADGWQRMSKALSCQRQETHVAKELIGGSDEKA